jgi:hypothetical protein
MTGLLYCENKRIKWLENIITIVIVRAITVVVTTTKTMKSKS